MPSPNPTSLWRRLTEPSASMRDELERRRLQLLSSFLVILIPLMLILVVWVAIEPGSEIGAYDESLPWFLAFTMSVIVLAYGLTRTKYYAAAVYLLVGLTFILTVSWAVAYPDPISSTTPVFTILVASAILTAGPTALVLLANCAAILLLPHFVAGLEWETVTLIRFNIIFGAMGILMAALRRRDWEEITRRSQELSEELTKRLQTEEASRRYIEKVADHAPGALYEFRITPDGNMSFPFISRGVAKIHPGLTADMFMNDAQLGFSRMHPDDVERVKIGIQESYQTLANWQADFRVVVDEGRIRWHRGSATPERRDDGTVTWFGFFQDITDRKLTEVAIAQYAERLERAEKYGGLGSWEFDVASGQGWWSKQMYELLGFQDLDTVPDLESYFANIHPEDRPAVQAVMEKIAKGQEPLTQELRSNPQLGPLRYFALTVTVEGDAGGKLAKYIGTLLDITQHKQTQRLIETQLRRLKSLHAIDTAIASSSDIRLTLKVVIEAAVQELQVDAAAVLLYYPSSNLLKFAAGQGFRSTRMATGQLRLGEGLAGRAALERQSVHVADLADVTDEFVRAPLFVGEGFIAYRCVPLIAKGQIKGVLEIFHRSPLDPDDEWLEYFETLAGQAAIAIDSAQAFEGLQRANLDLSLAYDATIEGWSRAMDLRDKETEGHTQRVTEMTVRLAQALGMSEHEIVQVRRGALLHDMGKLGVPDSILLKPGKLTDEEWVIMRRHPSYAYQMLAPVAYLKPALDIPHYHHEKWDGMGYPHRLKGEQIPLAARIFAVADVWDALRSDRPYRQGWPEERVREHIRQQAGTHFDPQVVEAFLRMGV